MDDHMEIGESGLVSTRYGFFNQETGQHYDSEMNEINEVKVFEILDEITKNEGL